MTLICYHSNWSWSGIIFRIRFQMHKILRKNGGKALILVVISIFKNIQYFIVFECIRSSNFTSHVVIFISLKGAYSWVYVPLTTLSWISDLLTTFSPTHPYEYYNHRFYHTFFNLLFLHFKTQQKRIHFSNHHCEVWHITPVSLLWV